jgi:hypothetical protein
MTVVYQEKLHHREDREHGEEQGSADLFFKVCGSSCAERPSWAVILSEAKNLRSCVFNELRRSFVAFGSSG